MDAANSSTQQRGVSYRRPVKTVVLGSRETVSRPRRRPADSSGMGDQTPSHNMAGYRSVVENRLLR